MKKKIGFACLPTKVVGGSFVLLLILLLCSGCISTGLTLQSHQMIEQGQLQLGTASGFCTTYPEKGFSLGSGKIAAGISEKVNLQGEWNLTHQYGKWNSHNFAAGAKLRLDPTLSIIPTVGSVVHFDPETQTLERLIHYGAVQFLAGKRFNPFIEVNFQLDGGLHVIRNRNAPTDGPELLPHGKFATSFATSSDLDKWAFRVGICPTVDYFSLFHSSSNDVLVMLGFDVNIDAFRKRSK